MNTQNRLTATKVLRVIADNLRKTKKGGNGPVDVSIERNKVVVLAPGQPSFARALVKDGWREIGGKAVISDAAAAELVSAIFGSVS